MSNVPGEPGPEQPDPGESGTEQPATDRRPLTRPSTAFAERPPGNIYVLPSDVVLETVTAPVRTVEQPIQDEAAEGRVDRCLRCHGEYGWTGHYGVWEPCPDCDPA